MLTYRQIEKIETFIKETEELKESGLAGEDFYNKSVALDNKIMASELEYMSIINWKDCFYYSSNSHSMKYYVEKIKSKIDMIKSSLQGLLDAYTVYPYILEVRKDIEKGKALQNFEHKDFIIEICAKYQGKVDFGKTAQDYCNKKFSLKSNEAESLCNGMLTKLEFYLNEICEEKKVAKSQPTQKQMVVNFNQTQTNHQETNVNIKITIEDCFKALDDCETLKYDEIEEIKQQLSEIENLLKDKKGKRKVIKEKISNALKWIANKGTDVMIAVLPFVLQNLQGL